MDTVGYLGLGIIHEEQGIPCQDALAGFCPDGNSRILVLSDGAGSARYAYEAAWANVSGVLEYFQTHTLQQFSALPETQQKEQILAACVKHLAEISDEFLRSPWEFSATLLFFVRDGSRWAAGHLGDGFLTVLDPGGVSLLSSEPENRNTGNRTYFTVSPDAAQHLRLYGGNDPAPGQVLMTSDGPCAMFRTRHRDLFRAADELLGYVREGEITSPETLARVLDQMNCYAIDRRDDWSVLIWSDGADFGPRTELSAESMMDREKEKMKRES